MHLQVIEDLRDECAKHGAVTAVTVPRPADKTQAASLFGSGNYGKVNSRPSSDPLCILAYKSCPRLCFDAVVYMSWEDLALHRISAACVLSPSPVGVLMC